MRSSCWITVLFLSGVASTLLAQDSTEVRGIITDARSGDPIPGVAVIVAETGTAAVTDSAGTFRFHTLPAGQYVLNIRRFGYAPMQYAVSVQSTIVEIPSTDLSLEPLALPMEAVGVQADVLPGRNAPPEFHERRERNAGSSITREEFVEQGNPGRPTDVLQRMSGIRVLPGQGLGGHLAVTMQRGGVRSFREVEDFRTLCPPLYFVDRQLIGNAGNIDIDAAVSLAEVVAVEAFNSVATLPTYFNRTGAACGVIVFWTRHATPNPTITIDPIDRRGGILSSTFLNFALALAAVITITIVSVPSIHF